MVLITPLSPERDGNSTLLSQEEQHLLLLPLPEELTFLLRI